MFFSSTVKYSFDVGHPLSLPYRWHLAACSLNALPGSAHLCYPLLIQKPWRGRGVTAQQNTVTEETVPLSPP